ncbi:MAG TPA: hypothetical protein VEY10_16885 [Flavisolibacter sp.]|nr:hypothetical protein [Flavisolibacter sp.]
MVWRQIKVYKFKTRWTTYFIPTGNTTNENGSVLINQDKSQVAVYHLWRRGD